MKTFEEMNDDHGNNHLHYMYQINDPEITTPMRAIGLIREPVCK